MKKCILPFFALLLLFIPATGQQLQMKKWYMTPVGIDLSTGIPASFTLNTPLSNAAVLATGTSFSTENGYYDQNGGVLFYIANSNIYDYNNTLIGAVSPGNGGAEVIILPFSNNDACQLKFNIFTTSAGQSQNVDLVCTVLDMKSYTVNSTVVETIFVPNNPTFPATEFGAIAADKQHSNGDYFIYFLGAPGTIGGNFGQIKKIIVNANGSVSSTTSTSSSCVYPDDKATPPVVNANASAEVFSRELELSADGQWLAWASFAGVNPSGLPTQYRYHYIRLIPSTGKYVPNSYTQFNITIPGFIANDVSGFRGMEMWQSGNDTKLFMGAGAAGIFSVAIPLVNNPPLPADFANVFGSNPDYGFSQIELGYNGWMYSSSPYINSITMNVGAFDPTLNTPSIQSGNSFQLTTPPNSGWQGAALYTLPDQIDGQDYSTLPNCILTKVATDDSYTFNSSTNTTWTQVSGGNPWNSTGEVQIINELKITGNSNLTISGMVFKFSPNARVIIDPGSTLTLDNTKFTSDYVGDPCYKPYIWKGIRVMGVSTANQFIPLQQGKLVLKSNAIVEYAECGVCVYNPLITGNNTTTGGIIIANDSYFKNNKSDIDFKLYENYKLLNGIRRVVGNVSRFNSCVFTSDNTYPFLLTPVHARIDGCKGLIFTNCNFQTSLTNVNLLQQQTIGIKSLNAGFTVNGQSVFSNLWHGIDAFNTKSNTSFRVLNSIFNDNQSGINIKAVNNVRIQLCSLFVSGSIYNSSNVNCGINLQNSSGYIIEENHFGLSVNNSGKTFYGILTGNSGSANN